MLLRFVLNGARWLGCCAPLITGKPHRFPSPPSDRVFGLEAYGVRTTTLRFSRMGDPSGPQQAQQAQQQQQAGGSGVPGAVGEAAGVLPAALHQLRQQQAQLMLPSPSSGRRQLASTGSSSSTHTSKWQVAAKCWALQAARRLGGERAVLRMQPWLL